MAAWSQLPYDLINVIANQLYAVEDFLAFSAVCRSWRSVYWNKSWISSTKVPWLMLDEKYDGEHIRGFLSLYSNKIYRLPLPDAHGRRFWGSAHEWLVTIDDNLDIYLLNPITQVKITLPPHSTFEYQGQLKIDWFNFIHGAIVLKIRNEFVVGAIYGPYNSLAFARVGDTVWKTVRIPGHFPFINVACYKDQIFAISITGTLFLVEIDSPNYLPRAKHVALPPNCETGWEKIHLLESCDDLLMLFDYGCQTVKFKLYKFDLSATVWVMLKSLGDQVLFVDDFFCLSVSSSRHMVPCKGNNIYFAKDNMDWWFMDKQQRYYLGIYNMEHSMTQRFRLSAELYTRSIYCTEEQSIVFSRLKIESSGANSRVSLCTKAFREAAACDPGNSFPGRRGLLREEGVNAMDAQGNTILHVLAVYGNVHAFDKLSTDGLLNNEELFKGNKNDDKVLHEAARFGQDGAVEFLLRIEKNLALGP